MTNKLMVIFFLFFLAISCRKNEKNIYSDETLLNGKWSVYDMPLDWKYRDGASLINFNKKLYMLGGWTYDEPYSGGTIILPKFDTKVSGC